jgi:hypothetical protein
MDAASVPSSSRRHLDSLLSKLRPFQRSAYEFAVGGVLPNVDGGGGDGGGSTKCSRSKENLAVNNDGGGGVERLRSGGRVAGAGTGRILVGDEVQSANSPRALKNCLESSFKGDEVQSVNSPRCIQINSQRAPVGRYRVATPMMPNGHMRSCPGRAHPMFSVLATAERP